MTLPSSAATYYIDWDAGDDVNSGSSTVTAWKRAPGMQGFSGAYTHEPGDRFLLKGGVTWPNPAAGSPFPWIIAASGSSDSTMDEYTADPAWFDSGTCGASFCRPILDLQSRVVASTPVAVVISSDYVTLDRFEIKDLFWTGTDPAGAILIRGTAGSSVLLSNLYIHGWTHGPAGGGTRDVFRAIAAESTPLGVLRDTVITAAPGDTASGTAVYNIPWVSTCTLYGLSSGFVSSATVVFLNKSRLYDFQPSFDGISPSRPIETSGTSLILANYISTFPLTTQAIVTQPTSGAGGNDQIINNVVWNAGARAPFVMDTGGPGASSATPIFSNNTIVTAGSEYCLAVGQTSAGSIGSLTFQNNHCISDNPPNSGLCTSVQDPANCALISGTPTASANLVMTHAAAQAAGYTLANFFAPTAAGSPTVDQGVFNAQIYDDIRGASRRIWSSPYDIGAYEYCLGCSANPTPYPVARFVNYLQGNYAPFEVTFDASSSFAPVGTSITTYAWNFGDGTPVQSVAVSTVTHTYPAAGLYAVTLTITTSASAQDSLTQNATAYAATSPAGISVGSGSVMAGSDIDVTLTFVPSPDEDASALQFDLVLPFGFTYLATTGGDAAAAAGKGISENAAIPRVIISGTNQNAIPAGLLATVRLRVDAATSEGVYTVSLSNMTAATPSGNYLTLSGVSGAASGDITVIAPAPPVVTPAFSPGVYPSPWRGDRHGSLPITFDQLSGRSTIRIFDVSGHLVKEMTTTDSSMPWHRDTDRGGTVASGLYFYTVENDRDQKASGKFVVIK